MFAVSAKIDYWHLCTLVFTSLHIYSDHSKFYNTCEETMHVDYTYASLFLAIHCLLHLKESWIPEAG